MLLMAGAGALLWQQQSQRLAEEIAAQIATVSRELRVDLENQASGLAAAAQPIAADASVQKALREGDADRLLAAWRPVFETLRRENHLTHFYFFDANRVCLLRVHKPEKRGDRIDRFTALEAERTGQTASGIELGPLGTFTLRVVQPVFEGGTLVGYVELGKEIEDVLQALRDRSGIELAVVIRKEHLNRQAWEEGMRLLGTGGRLGPPAPSVVIYASQGRLPDAFASWADQAAGQHAHGETDREIAFDGKDWRVVRDTPAGRFGQRGRRPADHARHHRRKGGLRAPAGAWAERPAGCCWRCCWASSMSCSAAPTRASAPSRPNCGESEEHLSATLRSIGDGVIACDGEGRVVSLNAVAETLTGWTTGEARGRPIAEVFRIIHAETRASGGKPGRSGRCAKASSWNWPTTPRSSPATAPSARSPTVARPSTTRPASSSGPCWSSAM